MYCTESLAFQARRQSCQLSTEQNSEYRKAFDILDKDGNGTISTCELGVAMRSVGVNPSDSQLEEMIKSVDADNSGTLNLDEFKTLMIREVKKSEMDEIREAFKSFDADGNGSITVEEARQGMADNGVPDEEIESSLAILFQRADFNKDKKISIEG